jgi:hypothetical protein
MIADKQVLYSELVDHEKTVVVDFDFGHWQTNTMD